MNESTCVFILCGCFIRIKIQWEFLDNLVAAREQIAKKLGADYMYEDTE